MLENFHLAAIVKERARTRLLQIPLHQGLQDGLAQTWEDQNARFFEGIEEIDFNAGYSPEAHERFRLPEYDPPGWLARENSQTIERLDTIASDDGLVDSIAGIVAMARGVQSEEVVLFQNFTRSRVIRPGRLLLLDGSTYNSVERPGLTLDMTLSAVYQPAERKLLFHSFRTVNTFLPLVDFYQEASEQEIKDVLEHPLLAAEDPEATAADANQWFRKRFAMLRDSGVLNEYSAAEIQARASGHDVSVKVSDGKILFPANKVESKKVLQFLNEELYRGPITETLYETNSKRAAS
ncbi:MAG: hypothetical protein OXE43_13700 [Chloroflexi bacterium]|nr:hypothetical protein [Chloroflexota bacterium]